MAGHLLLFARPSPTQGPRERPLQQARPRRRRAEGAPSMADVRFAAPPPEPGMTAALVLDDGAVLWGWGLGAEGETVGEVCFNTSMTGYQEILTDPSYAGQIIAFTFPHIGNVGANPEDIETATPAARGCVLAADIA